MTSQGRASAEHPRHGRTALPAKASLPRLTGAVARVRVFRVLDRALSRGAVWIAGPAGAGKTTAVASYIAARRLPAVWYDVDTSDTDVANVFLYLAKGLRAVGRSRRALPTFQVQHLPALRTFARTYFEALFAALPARATVVLENCHTVAGLPPWTEILEEAIAAVPAERHLVLVSRAEPHAGLSRQLLNQRLVLVTGDELKFTHREVSALARARVPARVRRHKEALSALCALADGWAAGLVLVLDHAARGDTTANLVRPDGRLFDYFGAEILSELPAGAQQVLLATSLLPWMTERMAAAVSGSETAGELLADLHRRGLLIERVQTAETTYRYHPLLRAFLLARADPSAAMLVRAAAACADGGLLDEAVDLYARAGAEGDLAALVLAHAQRLVAEGRYRTLSAWIERLGEEALAAQPWIRFWQATANMAADLAISRAQFAQAFDGFRASGDAAGLHLSVAGAAQAIFIEAEDFSRLDPWFARYEDLRRKGPAPPSDDVEATVLASLLMAACYVRPGYPGADPWVERAVSISPIDQGSRARLWSALMMFVSVTGRFDAIREQLAHAPPGVGPGLDPITRMLIIEAEIHSLLVSNWRQAVAKFREGVELARREALHAFEATFLAGCIQASAIGGDSAGSDDYVRQAAAAAAKTPSAQLIRGGLLEYARAHVAYERFDFAAAAEGLGQALALNVPIKLGWGMILTRALYIVALDALGRHDEANREAALMTGESAPVGVTVGGLELFAAERQLREGKASAEGAAGRALEGARRWPSYVTLYLRGLPRLTEFGLRAPEHAAWMRERVVENGVRPWPQHHDCEAWPWTVRVSALGRLAVAGRAAPPSRKPQRAPLRLLKCVIAAAGDPLTVGAACHALWPDQDRATARRNLDITLHRLRKLVGDEVLRIRDGALVLDRERCFVDAWAFSSLAARAERRLRQRSGEATAGEARVLFDRARQLYQGPLLPDDDDLPLVLAARERLRRTFVHLVLSFGAALERRAWSEAADIYAQGLEIDELAEPFSQGLMRAYLALGRPADVAKEYHRCGLALNAARGTQPAAETRALYDECRRVMTMAV